MKLEVVNSQGKKSLNELIDLGKVRSVGGASTIKLNQDEIYFISFSDSDLRIYIRFVPQPPVIPVPPWVFHSKELTGIIVSLILLYVHVSSIKPQEKVFQDEVATRLIFEKMPVRHHLKLPEAIRPVGSTQEILNKISVMRPSESNSKASSKLTIKLTDKSSANSNTKDIKKVGLLSALANGGINKKINKIYGGTGEILGDAAKATGIAGFNADSNGKEGRFKNLGPGAEGTSTIRISGIGVKSGRGTNYGVQNGLGVKSSVAINATEGEENFIGTIDREAVRRVIRKGLREIRGCYERELSKLSKTQSLEGKVVIEWTIVERGRAVNAKVKSSTLGNSAVENCVRDRLANWQFPDPPVGGVAEVNYPFYFRSEN